MPEYLISSSKLTSGWAKPALLHHLKQASCYGNGSRQGSKGAPVSASCVMAAVRPTPEEPRPVVDTAKGAMLSTARSSWLLATPGSPTSRLLMSPLRCVPASAFPQHCTAARDVLICATVQGKSGASRWLCSTGLLAQAGAVQGCIDTQVTTTDCIHLTCKR